MKRTHTGCVVLVGLLTAVCWAGATVYVNGTTGNDAWSGLCQTWDGATCGPKLTIQAGINAAVAGDAVLVADGTYTGTGNKDLDFGGKAITVRSASGDPATCIIDCQGSGRGFYFHTSETAATVVAGFTIRNGNVISGSSGSSDGGAVYCSYVSPTLTDCVIDGNSAASGGGVYCYGYGCSPTLTNCTIHGNTALSGGAVHCYMANATLASCTITGNTATGAGTGGGALACVVSSPGPMVTNCMISANTATASGGAVYCNGGSPTLTNCTITGNRTTSGGALYCTGSASHPELANCVLWGDTPQEVYVAFGTAVLTYCNTQGGYNGTGNINVDPGFTDAGDFHLAVGSPCIDAGTDTPPGALPAQDADGNPRSLDGNGDGQAVVDMGAYEFDPTVPAIAIRPTYIAFFVSAEGRGTPEPQALSISNAGGATLHWTLACEARWLQADVLQGESTGEATIVRLTADASALSHAAYRTAIAVSDPQARNSPRTVDVVLYVNQTLHVPGQYSTIQQAIDAAVEGDQVVMGDTVYTGAGNKDLDFAGKAITVRSASGDPTLCIIDCQGSGRGFYFHNGETAAAVVTGITILNGNVTSSSPGSYYGGAIYCYSSSPTFTNCALSGNSASYGSVYCASYYCHPALTNCTINGNAGAGLECADYSSAVLSACTISGNSGRGVYCTSSARPFLTNSTISKNGSAGLDCDSSSGPTLTHCAITGNGGTGVTCDSSSPTLTNCVITDNTAASGAGVYCHMSSPMLTNCAIRRNTASAGSGLVRGGGVYCYAESNPTLTNCAIDGNTAYSGYNAAYGGGVYCEGSGPTLTNCSISGNTLSSSGLAHAYGGGMYCNSCSPKAINCTIAGNVASSGTSAAYGGVYCTDSASPTFTNCILWGDRPGEVYVYSGAPSLTYCDVQGGYGGVGNTSVDPAFAFPGDVHLMAGSACIDAGTNAPPDGLPARDADGNPRALDGNGDGQAVVDMGAYEFNPGAPAMALSASRIDFCIAEGEALQQTKTLSIRNAGAGILRWTLGWEAAWLQPDVVQGDSTGEVDTLMLTAGATGLSYGTYSTVITFSDPQASDSTRTVEVVLRDVTLRVPRDYSTIQAGIDAAVAGDEVLVADGLYTGLGNRDLNFHGKAITVRSASGDPAACIIDCQGSGRGFYFHNGETAAAVVIGFTIRNGKVTSGSPGYAYGGGVYCFSASPTLTACAITGNSATYGGGVSCSSSSSPTVTHCTVTGNSAYSGGGVYCSSSSPTLASCTLTGSAGRAVHCSSSSARLTNCVLWGDAPQEIYAYSGTPAATYCDIQGGYTGTGNLNLDPLFINATAGDYHLGPLSPCIDAGDPAADFGLEPEPDGGRINMGAYGNTPEAETKGWIYIDAYHIVRKTRVGRTVFQYDLTTTVRNASTQGVTNLVATLLAAPSNVQIIDGVVNVGSLPAQTTVESADTFTIRVDRTALVSPLPISWRVTNGTGLVGEFTSLLDLAPPRLPGDANCDDRVDFDDINPFVLALTGVDGYYDDYPECDWLNADCNGDGRVDFDDINPFVELLTR